jgi:hypothetical protein
MLFYRRLERQKNKYIFPSYDELEEAMSTENPNQVNEEGQRVGIWIESEGTTNEDLFKVTNYALDGNNNSKAQWIARFSVDEFLYLKELIIRTGPNNVTSIVGRMYNDMMGIMLITD